MMWWVGWLDAEVQNAVKYWRERGVLVKLEPWLFSHMNVLFVLSCLRVVPVCLRCLWIVD